MEIKKLNKTDIVLWSKPKRIKENWLNAIIEKPILKNKNIQFIIKSEINELSYIVVSLRPLSIKDIENINLDNYIFEGYSKLCKGVEYNG